MVEYARSRELGYYAQKAMAIALGAVVDVDIGRRQAISIVVAYGIIYGVATAPM
jgi:MFS-type transporter involved in bile tolerance (Atg22 family)